MAAAPHLVTAGGGSIILISSAAGLKVQPFMVPYTTSKFAMRGMAKAFAAELGQHNIRVNSVHPTGVNARWGRGTCRPRSGRLVGYDRLGPMFMNMLPVDGTEPEDVADTVLFLASDESKFITAHEIAPDAGVTESEMAGAERRSRPSPRPSGAPGGGCRSRCTWPWWRASRPG